jgi:hypothetical protein
MVGLLGTGDPAVPVARIGNPVTRVFREFSDFLKKFSMPAVARPCYDSSLPRH